MNEELFLSPLWDTPRMKEFERVLALCMRDNILFGIPIPDGKEILKRADERLAVKPLTITAK